MKKISKLILVLAALAMVFTAFAVTASADTVTDATYGTSYFGDYTADDGSGLSGDANIIFGQVDMSYAGRYYGVIITEEATGVKTVWAGKAVGDEGKFGVALFDMPDGWYTAQIYMGKPENAKTADGTLSGAVAFYANHGEAVYVNVDWNYSRIYGYGARTYAGAAAEPVDIETLPDVPANAEFDGFYTDDLFTEEFDWTQPINENTQVYAKWVSDSTLTNKVIAYKSVGGQSHSSSIGSSAAVNLTGDNNQLVMTYDVLSGATYANHQTKTSVLGYLPVNQAGTNYNNGWSGVLHMGLAGNPAYTPESKMHYGYLSCTGGYKMDVVFGDHSAEASDCMKTGTTFKAVYTAPTAETTGSIVWYTKPSMAGDDAYVQTASMTNITESDIAPAQAAYMALDFYNCSAGPGASMTFTNFKIMHGDHELPLELFNHYDEEFTLTDKYVADLDKVYEIGVEAVIDGNTQNGWIMTKTATSTTAGGTLYLEMDVLESNLASHNVNIGIAWFNYLGVSNNWASGFHDTHITGNPMYVDAEDGKSSWKKEDSTGIPEYVDYLYVEEIWAAGNSVRVEYVMPTATEDGSLTIYVKAIEDGEDAWEVIHETTGIDQSCVVNSGNVVMMGMVFQASNSNPDPMIIKVTNLRSYNALGDMEIVKQHNAIFREAAVEA